MERCRYCHRSIPEESEFCAYCGKKSPISRTIGKRVRRMSNRALNALKSGTVKVREFSADVLSDIKKYVEESKEVPSFVNRNKVSIALGDLIRNIEVEKDENKRGELMAQATRIEQALSGEKCIICLQNFEFQENVPVSLCPNCN